MKYYKTLEEKIKETENNLTLGKVNEAQQLLERYIPHMTTYQARSYQVKINNLRREYYGIRNPESA